ncbi:transposase, MuDR, MULE transposase domain protein [Tanacetum coccineum]
MDGNNQIVSVAFGICKGETGPCWSWWMSVLKECVGDNPNLLFISDRHPAIALAVRNEFPLTFHVVCCRHLMMNISLKRRTLKGLVPLADAIQDNKMILMYTQTHQNRLHVYVSRVELSPLVVSDQRKDEDMVSYLNRKITRRFNTLYYTLPPNNKLSGMKAIKNDYDTNVMYDIEKVAGKLQIYVSHHHVDLSTMLIPNDGSLEESFAGIISEETKLKLQQSL